MTPLEKGIRAALSRHTHRLYNRFLTYDEFYDEVIKECSMAGLLVTPPSLGESAQTEGNTWGDTKLNDVLTPVHDGGVDDFCMNFMNAVADGTPQVDLADMLRAYVTRQPTGRTWNEDMGVAPANTVSDADTREG